MQKPRHSGILLHPTSLPGPHGSGDLGAEARRFIDWLADARQSLWQVLPLGGAGPGNSPYMSPSAFAGNELLIDLTELQQQGWLTVDELQPDPRFRAERVEFGPVREYRMSRLRLAAQHFATDASAEQRAAFAAFCKDARDWLDDYALFMALDARHADCGDWTKWPTALAQRKPEALAAAAAELAAECDFWRFCQWCFERQWQALKAQANQAGIRIIGDIPIFVSAHSADVWAHQGLFELTAKGQPRVVAGVPPDYFSKTGQRWGNPLYRWKEHAADDYRWWQARMRRVLALCDIVRIDHFRGFEAYWEIPAKATTAVDGRWRRGPGLPFFEALYRGLGIDPRKSEALPRIIAEDLGLITPEVDALRQACGLPGMRILQFAFNLKPNNPYLPHNYSPDTVVYTGTHDNDTTRGWWQTLSPALQDQARRYLAVPGDAIHWDLIRAALSSVAQMAVIPLQDVLGLGSEARMNRPGVEGGSWGWRFEWSQFEGWMGDFLANMTHSYGRSLEPEEDQDAEATKGSPAAEDHPQG